MWLLPVVLLLSTSDPGSERDIACANHFIERNYRARVTTTDLAARIADECASSFEADGKDGNDGLERARRQTYSIMRQNFQYEVQMRLEARRRREAIPLAR